VHKHKVLMTGINQQKRGEQRNGEKVRKRKDARSAQEEISGPVTGAADDIFAQPALLRRPEMMCGKNATAAASSFFSA
jgi:hypothetical protein